jgi:pimeloyl-ACP methyl ester carboxylesterase
MLTSEIQTDKSLPASFFDRNVQTLLIFVAPHQAKTTADAVKGPSMTTRADGSQASRLKYSLMEGRAVLEMAALPYFLPLLQATPRGDGHTVLLVPGFTATDGTMVGLRMFLRSRGYNIVHWGFGQNTGFKLKFSQALEQKVRYLHHRHKQKISLVGWSLGGVYSYFTAHNAPECVRTVISLGSPLHNNGGEVKVPMLVQALYRYFAHPMGPVAHLANVRAKVLKSPPPMPSSCLYSDTDGVVTPQSARIETTGGEHENIWVPGSHCGLGFNAAVMWILADRLSQPEGDWKPFNPDGLVGSAYQRLARLIRSRGYDPAAPLA